MKKILTFGIGAFVALAAIVKGILYNVISNPNEIITLVIIFGSIILLGLPLIAITSKKKKKR